jgi:hypothetical protein
VGNEMRKLSYDLRYWRAERPDEWTMDRFIRKAEALEAAIIHIAPWLSASLSDIKDPCQKYVDACNAVFECDTSTWYTLSDKFYRISLISIKNQAFSVQKIKKSVIVHHIQ